MADKQNITIKEWNRLYRGTTEERKLAEREIARLEKNGAFDQFRGAVQQLADAIADPPVEILLQAKRLQQIVAKLNGASAQQFQESQKRLALQALHERLLDAVGDPYIAADPEVLGIVSTLATAVQELKPEDDISSITPAGARKAAAKHAANSRHRTRQDLRKTIIDNYERLSVEKPNLSKNAIAKSLAPLALNLNAEIPTSSSSFSWNTEDDAAKAIRGWLAPSKIARFKQ